MPKVTFVKKAQKDVPHTNIKKGESYYWWKFRFGGKHCSKTMPRRSQLTRSGFLSSLYDLQDRIGEFTATSIEEFDTFKEDILSEIENLKSECEDNLSNMPESLQESSILNERIEGLDNWYSEIEGVSCEESEDEEELLDNIENAITALSDTDAGL